MTHNELSLQNLLFKLIDYQFFIDNDGVEKIKFTSIKYGPNDCSVEEYFDYKFTSLNEPQLTTCGIELDFSNQISLAANEKKTLNKPFRTPGGPKKFSVYVKNEKSNVVKVNFGDPNMSIKKNIPGRKKSFLARHRCSTPGPKFKARYWSCKMWR